jgi:hypothetical protein
LRGNDAGLNDATVSGGASRILIVIYVLNFRKSKKSSDVFAMYY